MCHVFQRILRQQCVSCVSIYFTAAVCVVCFHLFHIILINLYYTLIYPYLAYSNFCWASTYPNRLEKLKRLQKRAIRIIIKNKYNAHTLPIFRQMNILNTEQIRQLQTGIFRFKYLHKLLPGDFSNFSVNVNEVHGYYTRASCSPFLPWPMPLLVICYIILEACEMRMIVW